MGDNQNIIQLEDGWNDEIKTKALDPLEVSRNIDLISNHDAILHSLWKRL